MVHSFFPWWDVSGSRWGLDSFLLDRRRLFLCLCDARQNNDRLLDLHSAHNPVRGRSRYAESLSRFFDRQAIGGHPLDERSAFEFGLLHCLALNHSATFRGSNRSEEPMRKHGKRPDETSREIVDFDTVSSFSRSLDVSA
jgi:hypothetical protein